MANSVASHYKSFLDKSFSPALSNLVCIFFEFLVILVSHLPSKIRKKTRANPEITDCFSSDFPFLEFNSPSFDER